MTDAYRSQLTAVLAEIDSLITEARSGIHDGQEPDERIRSAKVPENMEAVRETVEEKLRDE